jgi:cytoskeletal protein CcmA (bactofilin family)
MNNNQAPTRAADAFDTPFFFGKWLNAVSGNQPALSDTTEAVASDDSEFYIGSFLGSKCEVAFDGILHFDGYTIGNINSPDGTLVLTRRGRIEADINVRVAIINGWVTGNIFANERVILESEAKVTGQIYTPALSVRLGAIFDGECVTTSEPGFESKRTAKRSNENLAMAAGV